MLKKDTHFWNPRQLTNSFLYLDRYKKERLRVNKFAFQVPCHQAWWPMKPYTLDNNLEPQTRPLHDFQEGYNPFNTRKLHPTSPRSCLAECEPFCLQPRKKSTQRTSLGTNKGTSLGSYPKKLKKKKKKRLTHWNKVRTLSSLVIHQLCCTSCPTL